MRILLDTNVIIDHLRGKTEPRAYLESMRKKEIEGLISCLSVMELHAVPVFKPGDEAAIGQLIGILDVLPVTPSIALSAGRLLARYRKAHGLEPIDALIAATALDCDTVLATANDKHFRFIDGLVVVRP